VITPTLGVASVTEIGVDVGMAVKGGGVIGVRVDAGLNRWDERFFNRGT